jgi:hypothetical protein
MEHILMLEAQNQPVIAEFHTPQLALSLDPK